MVRNCAPENPDSPICNRTSESEPEYASAENSFIIFVDRIFTTFSELPFTNVFDAIAPIAAVSCLYPACNGD
jgi:hypothetical protein